MTELPEADRWRVDTAPQSVVDLPLSPAAAGRAAGGVAAVLLIRSIVAGVGAVALLVAAVLLFDHGVRPDKFPSFVAGSSDSVVTRYSGPWIGGAAGVALLAGLSFTSFGVDLFRWVRLQRARGRA